MYMPSPDRRPGCANTRLLADDVGSGSLVRQRLPLPGDLGRQPLPSPSDPQRPPRDWGDNFRNLRPGPKVAAIHAIPSKARPYVPCWPYASEGSSYEDSISACTSVAQDGKSGRRSLRSYESDTSPDEFGGTDAPATLDIVERVAKACAGATAPPQGKVTWVFVVGSSGTFREDCFRGEGPTDSDDPPDKRAQTQGVDSFRPDRENRTTCPTTEAELRAEREKFQRRLDGETRSDESASSPTDLGNGSPPSSPTSPANLEQRRIVRQKLGGDSRGMDNEDDWGAEWPAEVSGSGASAPSGH